MDVKAALSVGVAALVLLAASAGLLAWRDSVNDDAARTWNRWTPAEQQTAYQRDSVQTRRFMEDRGVAFRMAG